MFRLDLKIMQDSLIRKLYWGEILLTLMTTELCSWQQQLYHGWRNCCRCHHHHQMAPPQLHCCAITLLMFILCQSESHWVIIGCVFAFLLPSFTSYITHHPPTLPPHLFGHPLLPLPDIFPRLPSFVICFLHQLLLLLPSFTLPCSSSLHPPLLDISQFK